MDRDQPEPQVDSKVHPSLYPGAQQKPGAVHQPQDPPAMEEVEKPAPGNQQQPGAKQHLNRPQQQPDGTPEAPERPHPTLSLPSDAEQQPGLMQQLDVVDLKEPKASLMKDSSTEDFMKDFTKDSTKNFPTKEPEAGPQKGPNASRRPSHHKGLFHEGLLTKDMTKDSTKNFSTQNVSMKVSSTKEPEAGLSTGPDTSTAHPTEDLPAMMDHPQVCLCHEPRPQAFPRSQTSTQTDGQN